MLTSYTDFVADLNLEPEQPVKKSNNKKSNGTAFEYKGAEEKKKPDDEDSRASLSEEYEDINMGKDLDMKLPDMEVIQEVTEESKIKDSQDQEKGKLTSTYNNFSINFIRNRTGSLEKRYI